MSKRRLFVLFADLLLIQLATLAALVLRDNLEVSVERLIAIAPYFLATLVASLVVLPVLGTTRSMWRFAGTPDFIHLVTVALLVVPITMGIAFGLNRMEDVPRSLPILQGLIMILAQGAARILIRSYHRSRRPAVQFSPAAAKPLDSVLIVGVGPLAELYLASVNEFGLNRLNIAGFVANKARHAGRLVQRHKVLGTPVDLPDVLARLEVEGVFVDRIVVAVPVARLRPREREILREIETSTSIEVEFLAETLGLERRDRKDRGQTTGEPGSEPPVFKFASDELARLAERPFWTFKRTADFVVATLLFVLLTPAFCVVAALVGLDVGRPILFSQRRPGLGGYPFALLKFRTMGEPHDDKGCRIPDHLRVSRIGHFLRRTRLDELPQLLNIMAGHMSFIGPRPLLPVDQPKQFAARLLVRPGLTGWAQVEGGRIISADDKAALDVWYIREASVGLDLRILLKTVRMVVKGEIANLDSVRQAWGDLERAGVCRRLGSERPGLDGSAGGPLAA